jgi:TRAP-type mannitol/chloroaromatic compound transport system substrate-binding protein
MDRRAFLTTAIALGAATGCSKSQFESGVNINRNRKIKLKLATSWPIHFPIMGTAVDRFAERVKQISGGSIEIEVFGKNQLVPALAVFDVASSGGIDIFHSGPYYWKGKNIAVSIFGGVPFGMTAAEAVSWFEFGGGYELWREIYAKYNLYPILGGNTGPQMGGWFRKKINSLNDLKGLKMRIPGLGGELFSRLGVNTILLPAGEIFTALEKGTIDATEWVGPALDIKMGFHKIAKYYYSGWNEPGSILELTFNLKSWNRLSDEQKAIIETAAKSMNSDMLYEFQYQNSIALDEVKKAGVIISKFPSDITNRAKKEFQNIVDRFSSESEDFRRVWESYDSYLSRTRKWSSISIKSYLEDRG